MGQEGDKMALEIIKNIADAEQKSDTIKNNALAQAQQFMLEGDNKCKEVFKKANKEVKITSVKLVEEAINLAQAEVNAITLEADKNCEMIKNMASQKMSEAVDEVVRKVVG